jgi:hypothetical protein
VENAGYRNIFKRYSACQQNKTFNKLLENAPLYTARRLCSAIVYLVLGHTFHTTFSIFFRKNIQNSIQNTLVTPHKTPHFSFSKPKSRHFRLSFATRRFRCYFVLVVIGPTWSSSCKRLACEEGTFLSLGLATSRSSVYNARWKHRFSSDHRS